MKRFMKIKEAAATYGLGVKLLYRAIHNKELKAYKPNGRDFLLKVEELENWIESKSV
jgi:excisionase family DNA binding protein